MSQLIPDYLNIDFDTLKERLKTQIKKESEFNDVDYEGSNIATLIEMMAYVSEINTYYLNKIAQNLYLDTVGLYENAHRLARLRGYNPKGPISGETTLTITVSLTGSEVDAGDVIEIPAWFTFDTGETTEDDESINYTTFESTLETIPATASDSYSFNITLKQGYYRVISITGEDLLDNQYLLTDDTYDYGIYPYTNPSTLVYVNGVEWERIEDPFDDLSGLPLTQNVYKFGFDKNQRAYFEFYEGRNLPEDSDKIEMICIRTLGEDGAIGSGIITSFSNQTIPSINTVTNKIEETADTAFITNSTKGNALTSDSVTITNSTSLYQSDKETVDEIKDGSDSELYSQKRTVTKDDYKERIENNSEVAKANVWGEKEENPGNTNYYYKIYISVVPKTWGNSTIDRSTTTWTDDGDTQTIYVPSGYNSNFEDDLKTFLEPYKYINTQEIFRSPDLVYFRFDIGLKVSRTYNFSTVSNTVKNKLIWYFNSSNRDFNETIDFKEIHNFIIDEGEYSTTDYFSAVRGIKNLVIRDIETYTPSITSGSPTDIYEYNSNNNYPMYDDIDLAVSYDNLLRPIKLGYNQFPAIAEDLCLFINEG